MAIDPLNSGRVRIVTDGKRTKASGNILRNESNGAETIELTVDPGKTTAKELKSILSHLGINNIDVDHLTDSDSIVNAEDLEHIDLELESDVAIRDLENMGLKNETAKSLFANNREKVTDPEYMAALWRLNGCGIKIDYFLIYALSPEKAKNTLYINSLLKLNDEGIEITEGMISSLDLARGTNPVFMDTFLMIVKEEAGKPGYPEFVDKKIENSINYDNGQEFNFYTYKMILFPAKKRDINPIAHRVLYCLTLERAENCDYMDLLKGSAFKFDEADMVYNELRTGLPLNKIRGASLSVATLKALFAAVLEHGSDRIMGEHLSSALKDYSLRFIEAMNREHERTPVQRAEKLNGLSAGELFQLLATGNEEAYTSTFRIIFDRMLVQMKQEGVRMESIISTLDQDFTKTRLIISSCVSYGRLDDLLATMDKKASNELLRRFIMGLSASYNRLGEASCIAEVIINVSDPATRSLLMGYLVEAYNNANERGLKLIYGIIGAVCYAKKPSPILAQFKDNAPNMAPIDSVNRSELVNADNQIIERLYFFGDDDGQASYDSFFAMYSRDKNWELENRSSYKNDRFAVFSRTVKGVKLLIYANKPRKDDAGNADIDALFSSKKLSATIVVVRGHSYHAGDFISRISKARIVVLGCCGGFNDISSVLRGSPNASIFSTKGTGTMNVNDPLLHALNEEVLSHNVINWNEFWVREEKRISANAPKDYQFYVPPNKNILAIVTADYTRQSGEERDKYSLFGFLSITNVYRGVDNLYTR